MAGTGWNPDVIQMQDSEAQQKAQISAGPLFKDKERLDWLDEQNWLVVSDQIAEVFISGRCESIRDAIDVLSNARIPRLPPTSTSQRTLAAA